MFWRWMIRAIVGRTEVVHVALAGDVGGCSAELARLAPFLVEPGTTIVQVGDLVDRGPDSPGVRVEGASPGGRRGTCADCGCRVAGSGEGVEAGLLGGGQLHAGGGHVLGQVGR